MRKGIVDYGDPCPGVEDVVPDNVKSGGPPLHQGLVPVDIIEKILSLFNNARSSQNKLL